MTKKLVRSMMIGFCIFVAAVAIAYFVCTSAFRMTKADDTEMFMPIEQTAEALSNAVVSDNFDYYMARFDGENISVYSCDEGYEEFMYTLDVRIEDIGSEELERLKNGIMLETRQDLASFEEDFTS